FGRTSIEFRGHRQLPPASGFRGAGRRADMALPRRRRNATRESTAPFGLAVVDIMSAAACKAFRVAKF
ncbi:MAG: hypothetical protein ACREFC_03485, partial [Stellaceae bacterium]